MDQAQQVERFSADLIVDVKGEWLRAPARKPMRPDMISALPPDDLPRLAGHAFAKRVRQPVGNLPLSKPLLEQADLKAPADDDFHSGCPKTCSKVTPGSL